MQVEHYIGGAERVSTIQVNSGLQNVVLSVKVPNLTPADVVSIQAQAEITNNLSFNVGVGRMILRSPIGPDNVGSGTYVLPAAMDNVDPYYLHHKVLNLATSDSGVTGDAYYNLIVYAVSSAGSGLIQVESGYGTIRAIVMRS
ncbi:hypothetical protein [Bosea minatitlanensis]|uniref:Uncharacterized protein n=1 Tax=Bosea minatitlanensis TaxID=128782 RepID=A0ABW0F660_9HYPH|nr:hypothetical protein [Bosea minatitlanensis]MCT4493681.1 hypothetical protein [Bosea minatitlanensis]